MYAVPDHFTIAQRRAVARLRRGERLWVARMQRENVAAICLAGLGYVLDSGWLCGQWSQQEIDDYKDEMERIVSKRMVTR